ncbi:L-threonylcarbamoyladenylate synthase [Pontiella agarivorans]|uniref:L-threonylcarbamoyladenylate synthase n=1 Tax=Pontiella agarivorans TaxID=3038953 RepID=A0ABU5MVQ8_9BACT|nr:L-threonylcarbamoyladenylate synthase [Pontiella agarivorans]MDZ8118289.1 L-threonylcarbamoyladenylate synthase [Pontiella agarivorans]
MTLIATINRETPDFQTLKTARDVLHAGGLVIVPTETVYGIACDPAVPGALEKLIRAKGRDGDKPIARLAADGTQVKAASRHWNSGLDALASKWWPGPLTLIVETADGWTGYRVPDHAVPVELAKICGRTLALTSANLSGEPDTKTAQEAIASIPADLALDSGPSATEAIPSTVIKADGDDLTCIREGRVPFSQIQQVFFQGLEQ